MRRFLTTSLLGAWLLALAPVGAQAAPTLPAGPPVTAAARDVSAASPRHHAEATVGETLVAAPGTPPRTTLSVAPSLATLASSPLGTWSELGPKPITGDGMSGRVLALATSGGVTPDAAHPLFLGAAGGGVWKSIDGSTWQVAGNYDTMPNLAVDAVTVDPHTFGTATTLRVLAGSGEVASAGDAQAGAGIFLSIDGGATWTRSGDPFDAPNYAVSTIVFDPLASSQFVFAGITQKASRSIDAANRGVAVSADRGLTWSTPLNSLRGHDVTDLAIDANGNLYAAVGDGTPANGVYYSTDHGVSFARIGGDSAPFQLWWKLALAPSTAGLPRAGQILYAAEGSTSPGRGGTGAIIKMWRSPDGGTNWRDISGILPLDDESSGAQQSWYDMWVAVDSSLPNTVYFATTDIFRTTDANSGTPIWTDLTNVYGGPCRPVTSCTGAAPAKANLHPDQHAIAFYGSNSIYLGNDGGVQRTQNAMSTFSTANAGLGTTQFYGGAVSPDENLLFGGLQDNGSVLTTNAGSTWFDQTRGDGFFTAIDPTDTNIMYAEYPYGRIKITKTGAGGFANSVDPSSGADPYVAFVAPMALDTVPSTHVFYSGRQSVWSTSTAGTPWTRHYISPDGSSTGDFLRATSLDDFITSLGAANGAIYAVDRYGNTYVTMNGTSWSAANGPVASTCLPLPLYCRSGLNRVNSVAVDPTAPAIAYETVAGFGPGGGHVYKTSDSGATWIDVSLTLPDYNFNTISISPADHRILYAGSSRGVFLSTDAGATWSQLGQGLPNAKVDGVVARGSSVYSFTHGRGVWKFSPSSAALPRRMVLPALANNAYGGYTTVLYGKNTGTATANVSVRYFDASGAPAGAGDNAVVPVNGGFTFRQDSGRAFAPDGAGVGVISSDQPVSAFVNEFAPGGLSDATSYTGVPIETGTGTGPTVFAPTIANNAYGGYTTGIGLVNMGGTPTDITITYRYGDGSVVNTQILSAVSAGAYQGVYSGSAGLPDGFAGSASITSSNGSPLAAIINETGPGGQFSSYDTVRTGNSTLFAPTMLRNAFGGYNTGLALVETSGNAGFVTLTYTDSAGIAYQFANIPIAANGFLGVYQGDGALAPPFAGNYTAKITTTGPARVSAIVNGVAAGGSQSTSYNTFATGAPTVNLALLEANGRNGLTTSVGIMNTAGTTATVVLSYFDLAAGTPVGTVQTLVLPAGATAAIYQGNSANGLPAGLSATATLEATGGLIAVICNEIGPGIFMSYVGG